MMRRCMPQLCVIGRQVLASSRQSARRPACTVRSVCQRNLCSTSTFVQQSTQSSTSSTTTYLGQPSFQSHPHLMADNQLMPGISKQEFSLRRVRLFDAIRKHLQSSNIWTNDDQALVVVVPANKTMYSAPDVPVRFRQDSNFLYLTGLHEPNACLVLYADTQGKIQECLFVQPFDAHKQLWEGPIPGPDGVMTLTGIEQAQSRDRLVAFVEDLLSKKSTHVCADLRPLKSRESGLLQNIFNAHAKVMNVTPERFIHELRWIKSPGEQALMRTACDRGSVALNNVIQFTKPGMNESFLVGKMELEARLRGSGQLAYPPVVGAGQRANIIHYMQADQIIQPTDLILMDAGIDYFGYVSDITRTWPAAGQYIGAQLAMYEALLEVQYQLLQFARTRRPLSVNDLLTEQMELLAVQFYKLGLIKQDDLYNLDHVNETLRRYAPHHVSHYLGMDVHDTATVSRSRALQPGVVITIEPGVYLPLDDQRVPEELRGLGIRIEDDILITEHGIEVLTDKCVRDVDDVQALFRV